MAYADELAAIARKPSTIVVINLDYCNNTFGSAPCTATGVKCYNTKSTCKDTAHYANTVGKDYKFCKKDAPLPIAGEIIRPYLASEPSFLSTELDQKKSLTVNARVTLEFYDEQDNDIGIDPYVTERATYPEAVGTFWKKLFARNLYHIGRIIYIKKGFLGLAESAYNSSKFIIDQIDFNKGKIKIICKDLLKLADKVDIPKATAGKVTDNPLTAAATTVNCDTTSEYDSSGYIRIDNEIIKYTGKTATSFIGCTRGQFSTTAAQHDQNAKIQLCYVKESINVVDIILDIIQNYVGIAAADIDTTGFAFEKSRWLSSFTFTGVISKPIKASELLSELQEQSMSNIWWDDESQLVKFKVFAPGFMTFIADPVQLNDAENIVDIDVDHNEDSRISRVIIYYIKDAISDLDKPESYARSYIAWDTNAEGATEYNTKAIKTIYSQWITSSAIPSVLASRFLRRFRDPAKQATITLELKDSGIKTADIVKMTTDQILRIDGAVLENRRYQVLKKQQKSLGKFSYTLLDTNWTKNYGFIAPTGQPDWDAASEAQKAYAYISDGNERLGAADDEGFYIF